MKDEHFKGPSPYKQIRKHRAGLSLKNVNLDKVHKQLLNVLQREAQHLLVASHAGKLDRDESVSLIDCLNTVLKLKKLEETEAESLSDEELTVIAASKKPKTT